jgi:class 3 adenylate cyclase/tetratricopeptide (TPR) repeat protein
MSIEFPPQPPASTPALEIAQILFLDVVGYSKLLMDQQQHILNMLQELVRETADFVRAQKRDQLICLPTGDGMALVFFGDPEAPAHCALELGRTLKSRPEMKLRMGINTGPVYRLADINANRNVAGSGINMAQRVMDCGDAGHILLSEEVARMLGQLSGSWSGSLRDLGEAEVKHRVRIHIYNLVTQEAGNPEIPEKLQAARGKARIRKVALGLLAGAVIATLAVGGWFYHDRQEHKLSETDTVMLADFTNSTGDPVFDGDTLKVALSKAFQSPFLKILSSEKVADTLKMMSKPADTKLTSAVAREVCERTESKFYIAGSIARVGSQYVISLDTVHCEDGEHIAPEQEQAAKEEDVLKALGVAAEKLREKLGESKTMVQKYNMPLEQATTTSLEALKAYSQGDKLQLDEGDTAAIPFYKQAIALDPNFAAAFSSLATSYGALGEEDLARENFTKAYELRDRVSEQERLNISGDYYSDVTGELEKANEIYKQWAQIYPRDDSPYSRLGANYWYLGQYQQALSETLENLRLTPSDGTATGSLIKVYTALNRLDDAKATYKKAMAQGLDNPYLHTDYYRVPFLTGDEQEMERQVAWATGKAGAEDIVLSTQSDTEAFNGRLVKAREFSRRAVDSARRIDMKETAAKWQMNAALREAEFGTPSQAHSETASALALASTRDVQVLAALAFARAGDARKGNAMANDLAKRFPLDTLINSYWLPTIRAAIALKSNNSSHGAGAKAALDLLDAAAPYELGAPASWPEGNGSLYPVFVRGQAYLQLDRGKEAAAEFQKFLDHRGVVTNCPLGALARLNLARALALEGEMPKARTAYQDFLKLWKDADSDIPILREAKQEYARLKQ